MPIFRIIGGDSGALVTELTLDIEVLRARGGVLEALAADDAPVSIRLSDVGLDATKFAEFIRAVELSYRPGTPMSHRTFALRTVAGSPSLDVATLEALEWLGVPEFAAYARAVARPETASNQELKDIEGFRYFVEEDREETSMPVGPIAPDLHFGLIVNRHFEFAADAATAGQLDTIEALLELVPVPRGAERSHSESDEAFAVVREAPAVISAYNAALWAGNRAIAQFILERRPGIPCLSWNEEMREPLSENVRRGNTDLVHWLGAMPAVKKLIRDSDTGEDWIGRADVLQAAIAHDRRELFQWLITQGYQSPEDYAWTFAVQHGHIWALDVMRAAGIQPMRAMNFHGVMIDETANTAAWWGRLDVLQWLVDKGIGLGHFTDGQILIDNKSGRIDVIEFLINNGADFDFRHIVDALDHSNAGSDYANRFALLQWLMNQGHFAPTENDLVALSVTAAPEVNNWLWDNVRPTFSRAVMRRIFRRASETANVVVLSWVAEREEILSADEVLFNFRLAMNPALIYHNTKGLNWFWEHMAPFVRTDANIEYVVAESVKRRAEAGILWALACAETKTRALGLETLRDARLRGVSRIMKVLFENVLTEEDKQTALQDPELRSALSLCGIRKNPRAEAETEAESESEAEAEAGTESEMKRKRDA